MKNAIGAMCNATRQPFWDAQLLTSKHATAFVTQQLSHWALDGHSTRGVPHKALAATLWYTLAQQATTYVDTPEPTKQRKGTSSLDHGQGATTTGMVATLATSCTTDQQA